MRYDKSPVPMQLKAITEKTKKKAGPRIRLSCVLLKEGIHTLSDILEYLEFARSLGIDNVVFRQLMHINQKTTYYDDVVHYCEKQRVLLDPIQKEISNNHLFSFQKQVIGYYYYVEVWKYKEIDVVFEGANLSQLETTKKSMPIIIQELVFHPNAILASTWQPWDGILG